jgi:hypothetical protein
MTPQFGRVPPFSHLLQYERAAIHAARPRKLRSSSSRPADDGVPGPYIAHILQFPDAHKFNQTRLKLRLELVRSSISTISGLPCVTVRSARNTFAE